MQARRGMGSGMIVNIVGSFFDARCSKLLFVTQFSRFSNVAFITTCDYCAHFIIWRIVLFVASGWETRGANVDTIYMLCCRNARARILCWRNHK